MDEPSLHMPNITRLMLESVAVGVPLGLSVVLDRLCFEAGCSAAFDTFISLKHRRVMTMFVLIDASKRDNDEKELLAWMENPSLVLYQVKDSCQRWVALSRRISPIHERV